MKPVMRRCIGKVRLQDRRASIRYARCFLFWKGNRKVGGIELTV